MKHRGARFLILLLVLLYFAQGMAHARHASLTFDEGPHLAVGYTTLRTGDLRLQPVHIHPPLANVLAAAPLLLQDDLPDPRQIAGWEDASLSAVTDEVVWQYQEPQRLAVAGRLPILFLGVLLTALVARWAADYAGARAATAALFLFAFDPNVIAHSSLITTDIAATTLIVATLFVLGRYCRKPRTALLIAAGLLLGLAQLAKVSALVLVPVVVLQVASCEVRGATVEGGLRNVRWGKFMTGCAVHLLWIFVPAALVLWAGYGFELDTVSGWPTPVPAATHVRIYQSLREHYDLGHPTFLAGRVSERGWLWYFPVAFLLKTPLPVLVLGVTVLVYGVRRIAYSRLRKARLPLLPTSYSLPLPLLFPLLYAATSLFSTVNIGYRHLLPLLPFLYVTLACAIPLLLEVSRFTLYVSRSTPHIARFTLLALLVWQALGALTVAPHYLTFFNALAGGPQNGHHWLVDSNLDWGQNLWDLKTWLNERDHESVYYAHYSPARPASYGIEAEFLPPDPRAVPFAPWGPAPGLYAIGATVLQGPYAPDINTYAWFRTREPRERLGNALFLYEVAEQRAPEWATLCASPAPVLDERRVREATGQPTLPVARVDCLTAWYYPSGEAGLHVLPPETAPPPGALLALEGRTRDGDAAYRVYRTVGQPAPPRLSDARSDGPLNFLGYSLDGEQVRPGETLELHTYWEVKTVPDRPLSIMAHLIGPDEVPVAVGDGLGVPRDPWVKGGLIVQRHLFVVPEGTPPGSYRVQTGAYWLDTLERWTWSLPAGERVDHLALTHLSLPGQ